MDEEALNTSVRKFLKVVGVSSQREIEQAIAAALQRGEITGTETLAAVMTLEVAQLKLRVTFDGELKMQ
jgi:flavin-binding protein dodecin